MLYLYSTFCIGQFSNDLIYSEHSTSPGKLVFKGNGSLVFESITCNCTKGKAIITVTSMTNGMPINQTVASECFHNGIIKPYIDCEPKIINGSHPNPNMKSTARMLNAQFLHSVILDCQTSIPTLNIQVPRAVVIIEPELPGM